jgi:tRNA (cmo5U34)-methyltransferase
MRRTIMAVREFSFRAHAETFDEHIEQSIPGYRMLIEKSVGLSRRFAQAETTVVDIGCSTGALLRSIRDLNQAARPSVRYIGIDKEPKFKRQWKDRQTSNVEYTVADVRDFDGLNNISLATSLFTGQFIPERDKLGVLQRVYDGMVSGGALIIAEKVLASSARFQDVTTFEHYDFKRRNFNSDEILRKEKSLRGSMTLWSEKELLGALRCVGFIETQTIWTSFPFVAVVALKSNRLPGGS